MENSSKELIEIVKKNEAIKVIHLLIDGSIKTNLTVRELLNILSQKYKNELDQPNS